MTQPARSPTSARAALLSATDVIACLSTALLIVRWLLPAEAAARGDQLWIPAAWCLLAGGWLWFSRGPYRPLSLVDLCVALLIAGHLLGGVFVFQTGGQLRTTVNLMAEWVGLGCAWIVLREALLQPGWMDEVRRAILTTAVTVAVLGIWQHYVSLPQSAREFAPKIEQVREAEARGERSPVAWELARAGVPTTEPGRTLFLKRLQDSREPFGFFALANTLGGLLAACLVWGIATQARSASEGIFSDVRRSSRLRFGLVLVIAWCLALTKSRTAWVGGVCGLAVIAWQWLLTRTGREAAPFLARGWLMTILIGLGVVAAGIFGLARTGGWDAQILTEAPKSLSYRGQYWVGTLRLIQESPWFGVGLGQFREHYLRVKLPEASEEIADPHNMLLDAWVNGGIVALAGLLGLMGLVLLRAAVRRKPGFSESRASPDSEVPEARLSEKPGFTRLEHANTSPARFVLIGGVAAFVAAFAVEYGLHGHWDDRYWVLGAVWSGVFLLLGQSRPVLVATQAQYATMLAESAVLVALGVHLLGAGGLGMPAVVQTAFVWLAVMTMYSSIQLASKSWGKRIAAVAAAGAGLIIAGLVWPPILQADYRLQRGDRAAQQGDSRTAEAEYREAVRADAWSPVAWGRLADWSAERWRQLSPRDLDYAQAEQGPFAEALFALKEARRRDPHSVFWPRRTAELWMSMYGRSSDRLHAARATAKS